MTHPDLTNARAVVWWEITGALSQLRKEIPTVEETTFAWPYWRNDEDARETCAGYYLGARAGSGTVERYHDAPGDGRIDLYRVDSLPMRGGQFDEPWRARTAEVRYDAGWLVLCYHGIDDGRVDTEWLGWDPLTLGQFRESLDWVQGQGFWIAPFGTVTRYIREREHVELTLLYAEDGRYVLSLEDGLHDGIFSHPLTLRLELPVRWERLRISQHRREIPVILAPGGALQFDALPDGTPVYVERL